MKSAIHFTVKMNRLVKRFNEGKSRGNYVQGSFGAMGIGALIRGASYVNQGDEICPWSPTLVDFLLTYGIVNVILPLTFGLLALYVYCSKSTNDTLCSCISYIPILSSVINSGLAIWGLVLLYSNSHSVTYDEHPSSSNKEYCDQYLYIISMIIVWLQVVIVILQVVFGTLRYIRAKREEN